MHKVVIERPRWNPGPGKRGRRANLPDELLPKFEGIKRAHRRHKGLTDLLGPLKRWLHSQVGRPWNDVYSEACAVIKSDSIVRAHVKTHLMEFVQRNTFMHEGEACVLETSRGGGVTPVNAGWRRSLFYVHPESGLLEVSPSISKRAWKTRNPKAPVALRWIRRNIALKKIRGLWFECCFEPLPAQPWFKIYDHALERFVTHREFRAYDYRVYRVCTHKRQLSHRELKSYQLQNTPVLGTQSSIGCRSCRLTTAFRRIELWRRVPYDVNKNEPNHTFLYGLGGRQCGTVTEQAGTSDGDLGERRARYGRAGNRC